MKSLDEAVQKAKGHATRYQKNIHVFLSGGNYTFATEDNFQKLKEKDPKLVSLQQIAPDEVVIGRQQKAHSH